MDEIKSLEGTLGRFVSIAGDDAMVTDAEMTAYILDNCRIVFTPESHFFCQTELSNDRYYPYREVLKPRFEREFAPYNTQAFQQAMETAAIDMRFDFGHTSPNWQEVIELGFVGLKARADRYAAQPQNDPQKRRFYDCVAQVYAASQRFIRRAAAQAREEGRTRIAEGLENLLVAPPQNLYEAIQLELLYHFLQHFAEETWIRTFGRVDQLLRPFYEKEDPETAAALINAFIREINDHGMSENQPFALGGADANGHSLINPLSYVFLEEYKKIKPPFVKVHILCAKDTPEDFLKAALDGIRSGANSICFMGDATLQRAVRRLGASAEDALNYHVDGCYECGAYGELTCPVTGKVSLAKAVELALNNGVDILTGYPTGLPVEKQPETFAQFYAEFLRQLEHLCTFAKDYAAAFEALYPRIHAGLLFSSTHKEYMENGKDVFVDFGAKYNNSSICGVGLGTAVDSLLAVKKLVFEDKTLTLAQLNQLMKDNWAGQEALRLTVKNKFPKYGMGDAEADRLAAELVKVLAKQINGQPNARGGKYRLGMFTITARWEIGAHLAATPDGRFAGETTSLNTGASFGADREGPVGQILSVTTIDAADSPNAVVLDIDLHTSAVRGENGLHAMYATLKTYLDRGGFAIHYNVLDTQVLRNAQKRPEDYPNLQVRVCGWNMLFSRLPKVQQDEYIQRSERE